MFCTKCGNKLEENQKFCSKCGTHLAYDNYFNLSTESISRSVNVHDEASSFRSVGLFSGTLNFLRERYNGIKYIICFLVLLFVFEKLDEIVVKKEAVRYFDMIMEMIRLNGISVGFEVAETVIAMVQLCILYLWFVILSKRLKEINCSEWYAMPIMLLTFVVYSFYPWYVVRVFLPSFAPYKDYVPIMLHLTLILTALPHIMLGFIKSRVISE